MAMQAVNELNLINFQKDSKATLEKINASSGVNNENSFASLLNSVKQENNTQSEAKTESETKKVTESESKEVALTEESNSSEKEVLKDNNKTDKNENAAVKTSEITKEAKSSNIVSKKEVKNEKTASNKEKKSEKSKVSEKSSEKVLNLIENPAANLVKENKVENSKVKAEKENKVELKNQKNIQTVSFENKNDLKIDLNENNFKSLKKEELNLNQEKASDKNIKFDKDGKITVQDLRSDQTVSVAGKSESKTKSEFKFDKNESNSVTIELGSQNAAQDILSLNDQTASANDSTFQAMLNNQIQENIPEFVKTGTIILKDNDQGTINLVLHPEDLGNVKIHLSLDGKNVTGEIIVSSKEALQVFKDNSETLRESFIKNGFADASFNVSYGNSDGGFYQGNQESNQDNSFFASRVYSNGINGAEIDENIAGSSFENYKSFDENSINIVA